VPGLYFLPARPQPKAGLDSRTADAARREEVRPEAQFTVFSARNYLPSG